MIRTTRLAGARTASFLFLAVCVRAVVKRPLGPRAGAVKVTVAPATGFPALSVTVTASRIGNRDPAGVLSPLAAPAVTASGLPARFFNVKWAGWLLPVVVAVALKAP